ncbi:MAG: transposase [bacterium]
MPRLPRIYIENSLYYITSRGNQAESIFRDKEDYMMYLELLKKYKEQHSFRLFAFTLMPQQLNLLLEVEEGSTISAIMHDVTSNYTKYFNNRYQRQGHLFQARFKSAIIEKGPYLLSTISYMHLLPMQFGLSKNPESYAYTSLAYYLDKPAAETANSFSLINLLDLKEETQEVAAALSRIAPDKKGYADFFANLPQAEMQELAHRLRRGGVVGSTQFLEKVEEILNNRAATQEQEAEQLGEAEKKAPSLKPLVSLVSVALLFGVAAGILYIQKTNIFKKEKIAQPLAPAQKDIIKVGVPQDKEGLILTDLNGTEWSILLKSESGNTPAQNYYDKLEFNNGQVSSKIMSEKGFSPSNYMLKVKDDGTFSWETMQRNSSGEISFWRGETDTSGKMNGVFSRKSQGSEAQDFSFSSIQYIYRR